MAPPLAVIHVEIDDVTLTVDLSDGRTMKVPLDWYPRLVEGSSAERANYRLLGGGTGVHWPLLDEDVSLGNLLDGRKSAESQPSFDKWLRSRAGTPTKTESPARGMSLDD
ncbi:MAG: DUF2442 domain-containing protein [Planctomycetia bacterium]|nr:DUF2442 domain-containing protein [Planctomycetia bacterium]